MNAETIPGLVVGAPLPESVPAVNPDWNLFHLRGSVADLKTAINERPGLPVHVKAYLVAELDTLPPGTVGARIDAFAQHHDQRDQVRSIHFTVVAVRL